MKALQEQLGRRFRHEYPTVRVGKVIAVRRAGNSVDLSFINGSYLLDVPVMMGLASTAAGIINLIAPTVNTNVPVRKTYPGSASPTAQLTQPPLEQGASGSETPDESVNRDIYAVCMPLEGGARAGFIVLGFVYAPIAEMLFDVGAQQEFSDFFLFRHPSDIQTTIDRNGTISIQHPAGTRVTIGDVNAIAAARGEESDVRKAGVALEGKDINALYKLRKNKGAQPAVVIEDLTGSHIIVDGKGAIDIQDTIGDTVNLDGLGKITVKNQAGATAILDQQDIRVTAPGEVDITATGPITLKATDVSFLTSLYRTTINQIITIFNLHGHPYLGGIIPAVTSPPDEVIP